MREDYTHVVIILDESGSMDSVRHDTIGGLNTFLDEQKALPGKVTLTLVRFSFHHNIRYIYENQDLQSIKKLTLEDYRPNGSTALLKATEDTIDSTGRFLSGLNESERPARVIVMIVTDGQENDSNSGMMGGTDPYTKARLAAKIAQQRDGYKWEFVFLAANQDAFSEASSMGMSVNSTMGYIQTAGGTKGLYSTLSDKLGGARMSKCSYGSAMDFTQLERDNYTKSATP